MITEFFKQNNLPLKKQTIVLAVSGGPDSMALADLFRQIKDQQQIKLVVAHFDHQLRSDSYRESEIIKAYCQRNDLPFEEEKWHQHPQSGIEAAARTARYAYLSQVMQKYQAKYLVTAHHGDDLIENILLKFIRSGVPEEMNSLKAISKRNNFLLLRPLLTSSKQQLLAYVEKRKIDYVNDSTNFEDDTLRNRLRHHVVPLLKKENPHLIANALCYSNDMQDLTTTVQTYLNEFNQPREVFKQVYQISVSNLPNNPAACNLFWQNFIWQKFQRRVNKQLSGFHLIEYQDEQYLFKTLPPKKAALTKVKLEQAFNFFDKQYVITKNSTLAGQRIGDFWSLESTFYIGSLPTGTKLPLKNGQWAKAKKMFAQAKIPAQLRYLCLSVFSSKREPIFIEKTYQDQRYLPEGAHYYIYKLKNI